jgi:hypothetical protein
MRIFLAIWVLCGISSCHSQPENKDYETILQEVVTQRNDFQRFYVNAGPAAKDSLINAARDYLVHTISDDIFPLWYGTPWDFNGTTRIPRQGKIACGYFVTNILADVGFNIPRVTWAQSASEVFIKKLAPGQIKRFSNRPISEVEKYLLAAGDGIYLAGLDIHVGFLVVKNKSIKFVHSNYYKPEMGVMEEDIHSVNPLKDSKYRVIGKLMSDEMVMKWIHHSAYD